MRALRASLWAAVGLAALSLGATAPPSASAPAPSAPPASASASPASELPITSFADEALRTESAAPKLDEWKTAQEVALSRRDPRCKSYRVREWLKVHCTLPAAGIAQVTGQNKGVSLWVDPSKAGSPMDARGVEAIFPVRRGDGRFFELHTFFLETGEAPLWKVGLRISEQWVASEPAPIVVVD